jgi:hypothetical protein
MKQVQIQNLIKLICKITADIVGGLMIISCAWTGSVAPRADPADIQNIINHTFRSGKPIPMVGAWGDGRYIDFPHEFKDGTKHIIRFVANYIGNPDADNVTRIYLSVQKEKSADRMRGVRCPPGEKCARRDILFLEDHGANGSCDASSEVIAFVEKHKGLDLILIYQHVPGKKNRQAKYDTAIHRLAGKISNREL